MLAAFLQLGFRASGFCFGGAPDGPRQVSTDGGGY